MPKQLSDITHVYERTTEDLEDAQDALTRATESARVKVEAAAQARHRAHDDLHRYVRDNPAVVVVAGDYAYRYDRGDLTRARVVWAHHIWVDDPTPAPSYRVPPADPLPLRNEHGSAPHPTITPGRLATAWGDVESRAGEAEEGDWLERTQDGKGYIDADGHPVEILEAEADTNAAMDRVRAEWEEPNSQPVTIVD